MSWSLADLQAAAAGEPNGDEPNGDGPFGFSQASSSAHWMPSTEKTQKDRPHWVPQLRTGLGIDVHAFAAPEEERPLMLGGVKVPHDRGLAGHSDADVLAHAVADALLGAARAGDIGKLFPDTDPAYEGADSLMLLNRVAEHVRSLGFAILDVDSVVAAQAPKLSPHRDAMRQNLARAMGIPVENVGVKATTTEHLGFEGRQEGISAYATCLLAL